MERPLTKFNVKSVISSSAKSTHTFTHTYRHIRHRHRLCGSAAPRSTTVTMTRKVNGKTENSTPCWSATPENFITKMGACDNFVSCKTHANIYWNRPRGAPTNSWNITSCDFVIRTFPIHPFPSLFSCRRIQQKRLDASYRSIHQTMRFRPRIYVWGEKI